VKQNPSGGTNWIAISDLMSGVVAVMVILFAISALENALREKEVRAAKARAKAEELARKKKAEAERQRTILSLFSDIKKEVHDRGMEHLVSVDTVNHRIRLKEATFARGSACVAETARKILETWSPRMREILLERPEREIFVDGHTDSMPVGSYRPTISRHCARFDDNYTLSAARAREARKVLTAEWVPELQERVALAGFGDTRPLSGTDRSAAENRRVEIYVREAELTEKPPLLSGAR